MGVLKLLEKLCRLFDRISRGLAIRLRVDGATEFVEVLLDAGQPRFD